MGKHPVEAFQAVKVYYFVCTGEMVRIEGVINGCFCDGVSSLGKFDHYGHSVASMIPRPFCTPKMANRLIG